MTDQHFLRATLGDIYGTYIWVIYIWDILGGADVDGPALLKGNMLGTH